MKTRIALLLVPLLSCAAILAADPQPRTAAERAATLSTLEHTGDRYQHRNAKPTDRANAYILETEKDYTLHLARGEDDLLVASGEKSAPSLNVPEATADIFAALKSGDAKKLHASGIDPSPSELARIREVVNLFANLFGEAGK